MIKQKILEGIMSIPKAGKDMARGLASLRAGKQETPPNLQIYIDELSSQRAAIDTDIQNIIQQGATNPNQIGTLGGMTNAMRPKQEQLQILDKAILINQGLVKVLKAEDEVLAILQDTQKLTTARDALIATGGTGVGMAINEMMNSSQMSTPQQGATEVPQGMPRQN